MRSIRALAPLITLALAASGLNGQSFAFVGYLPVDAAARSARIRELEALSRRTGQTQLMIETPYRNVTLLAIAFVFVHVLTTILDGYTPIGLRDAVPAIFVLDVGNHLVAVGFAEIDVEVGHRHAFGIEEALEQQIERDRVEVGDGQRPGDDAARTRSGVR